MAVPSGTELLGFVAGFVVLYVAVSVGYRRLLFRWGPDRPERSPEANQSAGRNEHHCPHCGAINDVGFAKCYE